jgi:diguanylate cyclase (GGDEF)-like protein
MDIRSLLLIATLFMLLNGGVLGLMHKSLSDDVKPSAVDWRIGTLLLAGGSILLAVQDQLPPGFILPTANGLIFVGVGLYWRAMRRFSSLSWHRSAWIPALLGTFGVYWFAAITPSHASRVVVACTVMAFYVFGAAWATLLPRNAVGKETGRYVLSGIFIFVGAFLVFRDVYFAMNPDVTPNMLAGDWISLASTIIVSIMPVIGTTAFLILCLERVSRRWEHAAATDYLTGLPNRRSITDAGETRFRATQRDGSHFAVAIIDIDHFKMINDQYGHDIGDLALKHVAETLNRACRGLNMVGRLGGEEFAALIDAKAASEIRTAVDRLCQTVAASPMRHNDKILAITVSIGVGQISDTDTSYDALLLRADKALYVAKNNGRNRVEGLVG